MSRAKNEDRQWLWLLLWTILGAGLRLTNLDGKPPWTDEFRTLVLSLGNSFQSVPLDRAIYFQDLFAPLIPNPSATIGDIVARVSSEDRQPPIYFVLAYLWMKLFPTVGGLVNLWGARALPAAIGILTIPCAYICSYLTFRSLLGDSQAASGRSRSYEPVEIDNPDPPRTMARSIANFTAAMLAISPYGVFISQEARHYSLAIVWVIISITCLAIACRYLAGGQKLPISLTIVWVVVNVLGLGTHYYFSLVLFAQVITLGLVWWWRRQVKPELDTVSVSIKPSLLPLGWQRTIPIVLGTAGGGAVWWWLLVSSYDRQIPGWVNNDRHKLIEVFNPFFQTIGAVISMLSLLLIEVTEFPPISILSEPIDLNIPIAILSAILMLIFFGWAIPMFKPGIQIQLRLPPQIATMAIVSFTASSIGLYLIIPWLTGIDITRGARYHFGYFPGVMMLMGLVLASCWETKPSIAKWVSGKQAVTIVLMMGLISSAIVVNNYGYHKYYRPEQIVPTIQQSVPIPILIATTHNSLVQVGELMGLAWEMRRTNLLSQVPIKFLLAHQSQKLCDRNCSATQLVRETVERSDRAIDLWLLNFHAPVNLPPTCNRSKKFGRGVYGYEYQLYHCQPLKDITSRSNIPVELPSTLSSQQLGLSSMSLNT